MGIQLYLDSLRHHVVLMRLQVMVEDAGKQWVSDSTVPGTTNTRSSNSRTESSTRSVWLLSLSMQYNLARQKRVLLTACTKNTPVEALKLTQRVSNIVSYNIHITITHGLQLKLQTCLLPEGRRKEIQAGKEKG